MTYLGKKSILILLVCTFYSACGQDCGPPPPVTSTSVQYNARNTTEGSVATYTCQVGYRKAGGDSHKTCHSSGLWTGQDLFCEAIDCGAPPVVPRADLVTPPGYTSFHQVARYRCETGFQQVGGDEVRYCDQHGQWAGRDIKCRAVQCGAPPSVLGLQETYVVAKCGWTAEYACPPDRHHPDAPFVKVCNASGQWQGELTATCSAIRCGAPPAGVHTTSRTLLTGGGDYVTSYQCLGGSTPTSGDFNLTCPQTGGTGWQGTTLQCSAPPSCGPPPVYASTNVTSEGQVPGSRAVYTCVEEHLDWNAPAVLTCADNGTWVGQAPNCTAVECGAPPDVVHATYNTSGSTPGSTAVYVCDEGYTPSHNSTPFTASCDSYGDWSHPSQTCNEVDCGIPVNEPGMNVHYVSTTYGAISSYYCPPPSFNAMGESDKKCQITGSWTVMPTKFCLTTSLSFPTGVNSIQIVYVDSKAGMYAAKYKCNPSYKHVSGSDKIYCLYSAPCPGDPKVCSEITCGTPPALPGMEVSYSNTSHLSTASYSCHSQFLQLGNQSLLCNSQGIWEGLPPLCEAPATLKPAEVAVFPLYAMMTGGDLDLPHTAMDLSLGEDPRPVYDVTAPAGGFLHMDGSPFSAVDLSLNFAFFQKDFSVGFLLHLDHATMGTLAHAHSSDGHGQFTLVFGRSDVSVTVFDVTDGECGHVNMSRPAWTGRWESLAFGLEGQSLFLYVGSAWTWNSSVFNCPSLLATTEWTVRIGDSVAGEEGFHGDVSCLAVYDLAFLSADSADDVINKSCDVSPGFLNEERSGQWRQRKLEFERVAHNQQPHPSLLPWKQVHVPSLSACAKECLVEDHCRSFDVTRRDVTTGKYQCRLFDLLTRKQLVGSEGSRYYAMTAAVEK